MHNLDYLADRAKAYYDGHINIFELRAFVRRWLTLATDEEVDNLAHILIRHQEESQP